MTATRVEQATQLSADQVAEVLALVDRVVADEAVSPVSEQALLRLRHDVTPESQYFLLHSGDELVGFARLDNRGSGQSAEIAAVDSDHIRALIDILVEHAGKQLRLWAHGEGSRATAVMRELGLRAERVLLKMGRSLAGALPSPVWPPGVRVRTFVVGEDEAAWLAVNNAAFAGHPEQSEWTMTDLRDREREAWFDPAGLFLAERDGDLVGFHWTKVHASRLTPNRDVAGPIGEVYVVGVAPAMQGQHLGKALTLVGLHHLQSAGLPDVMLYVDESNVSAAKLYERLGFTRWDADTSFSPA